LVRSFTSVFVADNNCSDGCKGGKNLPLLIFSKKSEVSVISVLTGNKEVKMKVAYFGGKYDHCRFHRADCDVIT